MSGHHANMNGTEGIMVLNHFTKHHNITDMVIKSIDICDSKVLCKREQFCIQELNTIFPYGLNSRIDKAIIQNRYTNLLIQLRIITPKVVLQCMLENPTRIFTKLLILLILSPL